MNVSDLKFIFLVILLTPFFSNGLSADDWPMWKGSAGRGSVNAEQLPDKMKLLWVRKFPASIPAWANNRSQAKLQFDISFQPIVLGKSIFVPSNVNDSVSAYDTDTGKQKWIFYADGPVRFAPVANNKNVYFISDDGFLYCLDATSGQLNWKYNGGPKTKRILGRDRLISLWPARGAPVLKNNKIYFASSVFPFMGTFIHCVDANTGKMVWRESGSGAMYMRQPHATDSFAGLSPQGYLAATEKFLLVPGGKAMPAVYDIKTGKLLHYVIDKRSGGYQVLAGKNYFFISGKAIEISPKKSINSHLPNNGRYKTAGNTLISEKVIYLLKEQKLKAYRFQPSFVKDKRGKKTLSMPVIGKFEIPTNKSRIHIKAGNQIILYERYKKHLYAVKLADEKSLLSAKDGEPIQAKLPLVWQIPLAKSPWAVLAADKKLFVVTREGSLFCYGASSQETKKISIQISPLKEASSAVVESTLKLLGTLKISGGYACILGVGKDDLVEALIAKTTLSIIAIDNQKVKVDNLRIRTDKAGYYGKRISAHVGGPFTYDLPPYFANIMFVSSGNSSALKKNVAALKNIFHSLRPYGGAACLKLPSSDVEEIKGLVKKAGLVKAEVKVIGGWVVLIRQGSLPESSDWTHQYADSSNSIFGKDKLVKLPLGILWFGGPPNTNVLPRHGHGPSPQVAAGRVIIEGQHMIRAVDVYTGRLIWERKLKDIGYYYRNTNHHPGANEIGGNYVTLSDIVYVVYGKDLLFLDAATGKTLKTITYKENDSDKAFKTWGHISVYKDFLITTTSPISFGFKKGKAFNMKKNARYSSGSEQLIVMNRTSGEILWKRKAKFNFRHNAICSSAGKIFCIDSFSKSKFDFLRSTQKQADLKGQLLALDIKSGKVVWSTSENITGTFLNYSEENDILLQAGSANRDRARDETKTGMITYKGKDGAVIWQNLKIKYGGPLIIRHKEIITNGGGGSGIDLLTGKKTSLKWRRNYGCNTAISSEHLMTFRSGAAGFYDLTNRGGTGNFGGFKSSCTSNLIPANGILNAPDYTRTCSCAYQLTVSCALIHMPDVEVWTTRGDPTKGRWGYNLAALGDRKVPQGTLWKKVQLSKNPNIIQPALEKLQSFRVHSSFVKGSGFKWVASSGVKGLSQIKLPVKGAKTGTVRLYFMEPDNIKQGERVFDILLQDQEVAKGVDVLKESGGKNHLLMKEFKHVDISKGLKLNLKTLSKLPPLLCGVEVVSE